MREIDLHSKCGSSRKSHGPVSGFSDHCAGYPKKERRGEKEKEREKKEDFTGTHKTDHLRVSGNIFRSIS